MTDRGASLVLLFRDRLVNPRPKFHDFSEWTTHDIKTKCGRLIAVWPHPGSQTWHAVELRRDHADAFAEPCGVCYRPTSNGETHDD